jgi:hypothetical protein
MAVVPGDNTMPAGIMALEIVAVLDTVAKVAAIIGSAIVVVLVDMVTVVTFFVPLKLPVLISTVKGASILILAAGISSCETWFYKSVQEDFNYSL